MVRVLLERERNGKKCGFIIADEPRATVARLKSRYAGRDPSMIYGNYRLQNNRVNTEPSK